MKLFNSSRNILYNNALLLKQMKIFHDLQQIKSRISIIGISELYIK